MTKEDATNTMPPMALEDMPAQCARTPTTKAETRARYFNSGNAFNLKLPPVPAAVFSQEAEQALSDSVCTGFIHCDQSRDLKCSYPATSPLILASYAVVRPDESLWMPKDGQYRIAYVIKGTARLENGEEPLDLAQGDVVTLPASHEYCIKGMANGIVLWVVTDAPQMQFQHIGIEAGDTHEQPVLYRAAEIAAQLDVVVAAPKSKDTSGVALIMSSTDFEEYRAITPTFTLSLNTLVPGGVQRPHRHSSVAVTLVVQGNACATHIDGVSVPWRQWATMVTPPGSVHSHVNEGDVLAKFLIVQDGALHYYTRTMNFNYED